MLIIDCQDDFVNPKGSLFVPGADKDCAKIANFIKNNEGGIDHISFTLDTHHPNAIFFPSLWKDKNGKQPSPFTVITSADTKSGNWNFFYKKEGDEYIEYLENRAADEIQKGILFPILNHMIWPYHCILGTKGWTLDDTLMEAIIHWTQKAPSNIYNAEVKGDYLFSEHYGIFESQRPNPKHPETQLNQTLIKTLEEYETVFLCGEAKSHCVATSLKQILYMAPNLAKKLVILEDCMSDVGGQVGGKTFGEISQPIYDYAKQQGVKFTKSTDVSLTYKNSPAFV